jgi:hypothetical protein
LIKRFTRDVAADWFRASEDSGDFMGIRYGCVSRGSGEVKWHFISHIDCDGIGGFAKLLRERGAEIAELPQTRHPCRGVIGPLWNHWCESRKGIKCAVRADWVGSGERSGIPDAAAWHLFTVEETLEMVARCREAGLTVNSFLLRHLDHAVRPGIRQPHARIRWLIPVNLRGDIRHDNDTANHVSCVETCIAPDDSPEDIQRDILRRLKRGDHRANHMLFMAGRFLSHEAKLDLLRKERAKRNGNIGSFSNLGVWDVNMQPGDGWVFCPPVVTGQLLGAGCVTFNGRLGLAVQGCAADSWMEKWVSLARKGFSQVPQKV